MTPAPMLVLCAHTQSPDSQRRAPCQQSLSPTSLLGSLSYLSIRSESMGRRENLGTSLNFSLAQFSPLHLIGSRLFSQEKYCGVRMKIKNIEDLSCK